MIEVDGGIHERQADEDQRRTASLQADALRVIRLRNEPVLTQLPRCVGQIGAAAHR